MDHDAPNKLDIWIDYTENLEPRRVRNPDDQDLRRMDLVSAVPHSIVAHAYAIRVYSEDDIPHYVLKNFSRFTHVERPLDDIIGVAHTPEKAELELYLALRDNTEKLIEELDCDYTLDDRLKSGDMVNLPHGSYTIGSYTSQSDK